MCNTLLMYFWEDIFIRNHKEWIISELNGNIINIKGKIIFVKANTIVMNNIKQDALEKYDTIILYTSIYAGIFPGLDVFIDNYKTIKYKKLAICISGSDKYLKGFKNKMEEEIPQYIRKKIKIFHLYDFLYQSQFKHKILMCLFMRKFIKIINKKGATHLSEKENDEYLLKEQEIVKLLNKNTLKKLKTYCK